MIAFTSHLICFWFFGSRIMIAFTTHVFILFVFGSRIMVAFLCNLIVLQVFLLPNYGNISMRIIFN